MPQIHCKFFGKVQGVFFRSFIKDLAGKYELVGTVENLEDGSVEVFAQGREDILKEFLDEVRVGSPLSKIDSMEVNWRDKDEDFEEFVILY